jgi:hypothetical protein
MSSTSLLLWTFSFHFASCVICFFLSDLDLMTQLLLHINEVGLENPE